MWQGGGKGFHDIVMVTLGTGVGGGVIIDEKIIAGRHGLGGEIGHIHVRDEETEACNCGGVDVWSRLPAQPESPGSKTENGSYPIHRQFFGKRATV